MSRIIDYIQEHYRSIILALVMINTGLIFFLIVFIWSGALDRDRHGTRNLKSAVEVVEKVETTTPPADSTGGVK